MNIKKQIEVTVRACDICEKQTSRKYWDSVRLILFCDKHKWVEEILDIMAKNSYKFDKSVNYTTHCKRWIDFLREEIV